MLVSVGYEALYVFFIKADSGHRSPDSVAASLFQMKEVHAGYRQSGDPASKRRVRESCNAALSSLPEWPQQF
jgi:hypothetical protein